MTYLQTNDRLTVPARNVVHPTGDFTIASADGAHAAATEGLAIRAEDSVSGSGAVAAVSQLINLEAPDGEIATGSASAVTPMGEFGIASVEPSHAPGDLSVTPAKIAAPEASASAHLNLGAPKFTY